MRIRIVTIYEFNQLHYISLEISLSLSLFPSSLLSEKRKFNNQPLLLVLHQMQVPGRSVKRDGEALNCTSRTNNKKRITTIMVVVVFVAIVVEQASRQDSLWHRRLLLP